MRMWCTSLRPWAAESSRLACGRMPGYARVRCCFASTPCPISCWSLRLKPTSPLARAQLGTQRRAVATQRSNATIAGKQTTTARANYDLATRTAERLRPLTAKGYVPGQQLDQADVNARDAATRLEQAQVQQAATLEAIDTVEAANRRLRHARPPWRWRNEISRTPWYGRRTMASSSGLTVSTGEFVLPGQTLFTLISTEDWFAVANLRETDLGGGAGGRLCDRLLDDRSACRHQGQRRRDRLGRGGPG